MAKLAIEGHKTRGKEVIEILEMLGGKGENTYMGNEESWVYTIDEKGFIDWKCPCNKYKVYSIEKFLEKYPHKVGDKVCFPDDLSTPFTINKMWWDENANELLCSFIEDDIEVPVVGIRAYKEKSIDKTNKVVFDTNAQSCDIMNDIIKEDMKTITIDDFKANTKEWLIDKLGNMSMNDALQTINNIYDELHKPKYPKTYEECCNELKVTHVEWWGYLGEILVPFQKLLICRGAYWKIAGEQMGLGKPWEPVWNESSPKYTITVIEDKLVKNFSLTQNYILAFPTEEMRDAFYENFKDLIEECKEFL